MRVTKDDVNVRMEIPGAIIRQRTEFGTVKGYDKISGEYFTLSAGVDTTPLFQGLEGNVCQCPHWGFVVRGQVTTTDTKGRVRSRRRRRTRGLGHRRRVPRHEMIICRIAELRGMLCHAPGSTGTPTSRSTRSASIASSVVG